ncbi:MAG: hypothetical protein QOD81_319, partial [Solirubrobacteraceae bacterium]|nr:hypothetical protein [Solirubrobacteraceae bacterium]
MGRGAAAIARDVRAGRVSARELCTDVLARAAGSDLGAFWHLDLDGAL